MNVGEAHAIWRTTHVMDTAEGRFWSRDEFLEFYNDAQTEAARRAHLLVDSRGALSSANITAGEFVVETDPRIIYFRRLRLASGGLPLIRKSMRDMDEEMPGWERAIAATPRVFIPDYETNTIALWPPSKIDDTLLGTVVREPLVDLVDDEDTSELAPRYHRALLHWVDFRAYSKPDADTLNPGAAHTALALFEQEFGQKSSAIDEHWNREQNFDNGDFQ